MPMGKQSTKKKFEFQRYPSFVLRTRFLWARLVKQMSQTFGQARKKQNLGPVLGQHRLEKNSGGCLVRSGEIPSPRQTSIDKTNDCIMNYEQSALVRGSDPPYVGPPCSQNGRWHVAGAGQAYDKKTTGRCCSQNRRQKNLDPSRMAKNSFPSDLGGYRRTSTASSPPLLDRGSI